MILLHRLCLPRAREDLFRKDSIISNVQWIGLNLCIFAILSGGSQLEISYQNGSFDARVRLLTPYLAYLGT